jgi:hypothetical protein
MPVDDKMFYSQVQLPLDSFEIPWKEERELDMK